MMTLTYLTQDDLAALRLAQAGLIDQHNQATAAVRVGLVELHNQLTTLKGLQDEIYSLARPEAAALMASVDNPMPTLATVHGKLLSMAKQAGYQFPEWENEFIRGAKNGE